MCETRIITISTVSQCNEYFLQNTLNPLVSLIDLSDSDCCCLLQIDLYSVLFQNVSTCSCFGWRDCDFSEGTLAFFPPNRLINMSLWNKGMKGTSRLLCFHPSLVSRIRLEEHLGGYTYFRYRQDEALHLSKREQNVVCTCMDGIKEELGWGTDEYSQLLLTNRIEVLLNTCARFYNRQFITRHEVGKKLIKQMDELLDNYFFSGKVMQKGLPTAEYFSRMQGHSPAYLDDLLRHETGKNIDEYVKISQFRLACGILLHTDKTVTDIVKELGYTSSQHFCYLFKRVTGFTPNAYRWYNATL